MPKRAFMVFSRALAARPRGQAGLAHPQVHDGILYPRETKAIFGGSATHKVVHRVALFDKDSVIKHIISQSDVARYCCTCRGLPTPAHPCPPLPDLVPNLKPQLSRIGGTP